MKITFNNYMSGYNNTIYSNNMRHTQSIKNTSKELISEPSKNVAKNSSNSKVVHENIVNDEINLENNMLYYYRSQELKRRKIIPKEEKITKVEKL